LEDPVESVAGNLRAPGVHPHVGAAPAAAGADCLVDPDDVIGRGYGLGVEGVALIRPDGYLGLVADSADPGLVHGYLDDVLRVTERSAG
jgi:hypothetical protein